MKRIKQIRVKNLFGMFDHTISLNMDERITIIHGPNGFGKTAILRLLNSLFSSDNSALEGIPFDELIIQFSEGASFQVTKGLMTVDEKQVVDHFLHKYLPMHKISFYFGEPVQEMSFPIFKPLTFYSQLAASYDPDIYSDRYRLLIAEHKQSIEEIAQQLREQEMLQRLREQEMLQRLREQEMLQRLREQEKASHKIKVEQALKDERQAVPVHFIETQRLLSPGKSGEKEPVMVPTVNAYSQELAETIKRKLAESTTLSQSLDRTFPSRLVSPTMQQKSLVVDELRDKLRALESKRQYLMATGLLDQEGADSIQVQDQDQIDESTKVVLSVYAEDTEKKLGIFDELANKIDLLKRIINKRFLYKEMTISKEQGFVFTNSKGVVLSPNDLSSGEQHELILFYELLFKVAPGSLILIDEPEISLHVVWQAQFLEDVLAVTRLSDIDVLLATHSPDIVGERGDLMVELKGPA